MVTQLQIAGESRVSDLLFKIQLCDERIVYSTGHQKPKPGRRKRKGIKDGAPPAPLARFGINFVFETPEAVHYWRSDGCTLQYRPKQDDLEWFPRRSYYGGRFHTLDHVAECTSLEIKKLLGFPGVGASETAIANGMYNKLLPLCREWKNDWYDFDEVDKEAYLAEEKVKRVEEIARLTEETGIEVTE